MGMDDNIRNEAQEWKGKAKEQMGDMTDDERMQDEGQSEEMSGKAKNMGQKAKDKASDMGKKAKDAMNM
ncbi:CsbD family protein [Hamadaea sp. NPDC051192]|uniref:CsbD family protein n=1 Tax=Hamadaea sp. NPDC051192 TaxID=3154940 RepID=UPI003440C045